MGLKKNILIVAASVLCVLFSGSCKKNGPTDDGKNGTAKEVQWGTYQGDFQRTGQSMYTGSQQGNIEWVKDFESVGTFAPVIDEDGTVYVGFENGKFFALNKADSILWEFTGGLILTTPSIDNNGILYVGDLNGTLYAISKGGKAIWSLNLNERMDCKGSALGNDGTIYVCTETKLHAISSEGSLLWSYPLGVQTYGAPTLGKDGTVYVLSDKVYAVDTNGKAVWSVPHLSQGTQWSSPSIADDGTIYVHPKGDSLYAISKEGLIKWSFYTDVGGDVSNTPAISGNGIIYLAVGPLLYAIDQNGKQLFKKEIFGALLDSPPVIGKDGTVYVGVDGRSLGKNFFAFSGEGVEKFSLSLKDKFGTLSLISVPPAISKEGKIYIVSYRYSFGIAKIS